VHGATRAFLIALPFLATPCCATTAIPATRVFSRPTAQGPEIVRVEPGQWAPTIGSLYAGPRDSERFVDHAGQRLQVSYTPEWTKLILVDGGLLVLWSLVALGAWIYLRRREAPERAPSQPIPGLPSIRD